MYSTNGVSQMRVELERCFPGQDVRDDAIFDVPEVLHDRFQRELEIDELNETIALRRATLRLVLFTQRSCGLSFEEI